MAAIPAPEQNTAVPTTAVQPVSIPDASTPAVEKQPDPAVDKDPSARFRGDGTSFRAKLIGIDEVPESRGDKMCQDSMIKLKAAVKASGLHKLKMVINISLNGLKLINLMTAQVLHEHPVDRISFIARDLTDRRAFGYIFGESEGKHKFFAIKTAKVAEHVVLTLRDLFQVVYDLKKKEIESAKKHPEVDDGSSGSTNQPANGPENSKGSREENIIALQQELETINQMSDLDAFKSSWPDNGPVSPDTPGTQNEADMFGMANLSDISSLSSDFSLASASSSVVPDTPRAKDNKICALDARSSQPQQFRRSGSSKSAVSVNGSMSQRLSGSKKKRQGSVTATVKEPIQSLQNNNQPQLISKDPLKRTISNTSKTSDLNPISRKNSTVEYDVTKEEETAEFKLRKNSEKPHISVQETKDDDSFFAEVMTAAGIPTLPSAGKPSTDEKNHPVKKTSDTMHDLSDSQSSVSSSSSKASTPHKSLSISNLFFSKSDKHKSLKSKKRFLSRQSSASSTNSVTDKSAANTANSLNDSKSSSSLEAATVSSNSSLNLKHVRRKSSSSSSTSTDKAIHEKLYRGFSSTSLPSQPESRTSHERIRPSAAVARARPHASQATVTANSDSRNPPMFKAKAQLPAEPEEDLERHIKTSSDGTALSEPQLASESWACFDKDKSDQATPTSESKGWEEPWQAFPEVTVESSESAATDDAWSVSEEKTSNDTTIKNVVDRTEASGFLDSRHDPFMEEDPFSGKDPFVKNGTSINDPFVNKDQDPFSEVRTPVNDDPFTIKEKVSFVDQALFKQNDSFPGRENDPFSEINSFAQSGHFAEKEKHPFVDKDPFENDPFSSELCGNNSSTTNNYDPFSEITLDNQAEDPFQNCEAVFGNMSDITVTAVLEKPTNQELVSDGLQKLEETSSRSTTPTVSDEEMTNLSNSKGSPNPSTVSDEVSSSKSSSPSTAYEVPPATLSLRDEQDRQSGVNKITPPKLESLDMIANPPASPPADSSFHPPPPIPPRPPRRSATRNDEMLPPLILPPPLPSRVRKGTDFTEDAELSSSEEEEEEEEEDLSNRSVSPPHMKPPDLPSNFCDNLPDTDFTLNKTNQFISDIENNLYSLPPNSAPPELPEKVQTANFSGGNVVPPVVTPPVIPSRNISHSDSFSPHLGAADDKHEDLQSDLSNMTGNNKTDFYSDDLAALSMEALQPAPGGGAKLTKDQILAGFGQGGPVPGMYQQQQTGGFFSTPQAPFSQQPMGGAPNQYAYRSPPAVAPNPFAGSLSPQSQVPMGMFPPPGPRPVVPARPGAMRSPTANLAQTGAAQNPFGDTFGVAGAHSQSTGILAPVNSQPDLFNGSAEKEEKKQKDPFASLLPGIGSASTNTSKKDMFKNFQMAKPPQPPPRSNDSVSSNFDNYLRESVGGVPVNDPSSNVKLSTQEAPAQTNGNDPFGMFN